MSTQNNKELNLFTPEPSKTTCADLATSLLPPVNISFNGQGHFGPLTCAGWRDLSNPTRRRLEKKRQKTITYPRISNPWKSSFTTHLLFLSSNPKILKAFSRTVPTKMIPAKGQAKETNEASKAKEQVD